MTKTLAIIALTLTTIVTACVTTEATLIGSHLRPTTTLQPEQIVIYRTAEQVGRPYREVAVLSSSGEASYTNMTMMHKSMQQQAAAHGANAIILGAVANPSAGAQVAAAFLGVGATRRGEAIAIYVEGLEPLPAKPTKATSRDTRNCRTETGRVICE